MGVLRLVHVDVRTPDLDLSTAYYSEVLGLSVVERGADTVYLKCWDEQDHHSVRLRYDSRIGLDLFSFRVEAEDDLHELEKRLEAYGCPVRRISRGESVGQGESIRFEIPSGQTMELVWELERRGNLLGKLNPSPVPPPNLPGIAPPRIDHLLINAEEVGEAHAFFKHVLGFRMTEQVIDATAISSGCGWSVRTPRTTWPSSTDPTEHCITSRSGSTTGTTCARPPTSWPTTTCRSTRIQRGTASRAATRSTSSTRWASATRCSPAATRPTPDFPSITWTEDQFGRGLFYYENVVAQRFLRFHT